MDPIEEKKIKRLLLLKELYDKSEGSSQTMFKPLSLKNYDEGVILYLVGEGLVSKVPQRTKDSSLQYSITHKGVKEIEQARDNPTQPSTYLPAYINVVNIQHMSHSAIQQGTANSSQKFNLTSESNTEVRKVLDELNEMKNKFEKESEKRKELEAFISTIQTQINSPKPNRTILHATLSEVKNFLLGVNINLYTPTILDTISGLIG